MKFSPFLLGSVAFAIPAITASAATYTGNGLNNFGGSVGNGVLTITSNTSAGTITFSEAPSGGNFGGGNAFVLYIDSKAGGFADTSTLTDNGDGERTAVSGYNLNNSGNGGVTTRSTVTFPTGFTADYAIAFDSGTPGNINGYTLVANGGNNSFGFLANATATTSPYALTLTLAQLSLTTTSSLRFVGTLISETAYRSNEAIGTITPTTAVGYTAPITFTSLSTFAVPEPGSFVAAGLGLAALAGFARRRS